LAHEEKCLFVMFFWTLNSKISSEFLFHLHFCFVRIWEQTSIISLYRINWLVFITETECVYCAVRTGTLYTTSLTFSNCTFCPHSTFICFVRIWEQTSIISLYRINWLVFIIETECVYCAVRIGSLYTASWTFNNLCSVNIVYLCVLCRSENKQRLFPYTALPDRQCLLRGTDWIFIYRQLNIQQSYVLPRQCIYVFYVDLRRNSVYFPMQYLLTGF
jgi:hypothetical protein